MGRPMLPEKPKNGDARADSGIARQKLAKSNPANPTL